MKAFDAALHLRKATSRAKSDVANKLVSMLLHDISRRVNTAAGVSVASPTYHDAVIAAFGVNCLYCGRSLEHDRAANEHLEGMNRVRVGLHIPGNVAVACVTCNREKRRDDTNLTSALADSGWESFLSHNGERCPPACVTCSYWTRVWPNKEDRIANLQGAIARIHRFRAPYQHLVDWSAQHRPIIRQQVESLYRHCQEFATRMLAGLTEEMALNFDGLHPSSEAAPTVRE